MVSKKEEAMSLESWKKEFMPIDAKNAAAEGLGPALAHSLKSWKGMRAKSARRHGLRVDGIQIAGPTGSMARRVEECALCQLFFDKNCRGCPLMGDDGSKCFHEGRGYRIMMNTSDPEVMIEELEMAMKRWKRHQK